MAHEDQLRLLSKADDCSQCPIQTKLVEEKLLSPDEKKWLNAYHAEVEQKVAPILKGFSDERAVEWLKKECRAI